MNRARRIVGLWVFATTVELAGAAGVRAQVPGTVTTNFGPDTRDRANWVAVQSDGKLLVAGTSCPPLTDPQLPCGFALARYNADGSLDTTFGTDGFVTTNFARNAEGKPITDDTANGGAIQPDDAKIVIVGQSCAPASSCGFALARYNSDGSLDASFGTDGLVTTNFETDTDDIAVGGVALQPDGKILVRGTSCPPLSLCRFALARYNADGSLDATFGADGLLTTSFGNLTLDLAAGGVMLQSDGNILVAGRSCLSGRCRFALARYHPDGSLDGTFGSGGLVTNNFGAGTNDETGGAALQPDGKVVVAGDSWLDGRSRFALARYGSDGGLDATFGAGGLVTTSLGTGTYDFAYDVTVQADGRIVSAGESCPSGGSGCRFGLARYTPTGSLDATFGTGGVVVTNFDIGTNDTANRVIVEPDGKILAAGSSCPSPDPCRFALARYNVNGSLDTSFGP